MARYDFKQGQVVDRGCYICTEPIYECMGFARAGDFLRYMRGEQNSVREACGKCVERVGLATLNEFPQSETELDRVAARVRSSLLVNL